MIVSLRVTVVDDIEEVGECTLFYFIFLGGGSEFVGGNEVLEEEDDVVEWSVGEPFIVGVFLVGILECGEVKELEVLRLLPGAMVDCGEVLW